MKKRYAGRLNGAKRQGFLTLIILCCLHFYAFSERKENPLQIDSVFLENILPSRFKYYTQEPLGRVKVRNTSKQTLNKIKISIFIQGYMDAPQDYEILKIKPKSTIEAPLLPTFNKNIFDIDEDTPVLVEIRVSGYGIIEDKRVYSITILSRNAIDWREPENITSFVTPSDSIITEFTKMCIPLFRDKEQEVNRNRLQDAMAIYSALSPISYLPDPNMPYKKIAKKKVYMDKVQYPRETLKYKKGDCDDLSVLYATCLEAVGIKAAFVLVPGHIFVIFNTGIPERNKELIGYDETSYIIRNNYIWFPIEVTKLGDSFLSVTKEGLKQYRNYLGKLEIIDVQKGWQRFAPVALPKTEFFWKENMELAEKKLKDDIAAFGVKRNEIIASKTSALKKKIEENPNNLGPRILLGTIYGREGEYELGEKELELARNIDRLHPTVLNNLGNIKLLKGSITESITLFKKARESDLSDGGICFNLGIAFFVKEDMVFALEMLRECLKSFVSLEEAAFFLGFPVEEVSSSLTGKPKVSHEEIKRLLGEILDDIKKEEESKEKAKKTFAVFAGIRGEEIKNEQDLRWLLYWKE